MKITREEFKELNQLYKEAWDDFKTYGDYMNEDFLCELIFPVLDWVRVKVGIRDEEIDSDFDILGDLHSWGKTYIDKGVYSDDLDVIYDRYLGEEEYE